MTRKTIRAGALMIGFAATLAVALGAEGERLPSIRALMHKQYTVSNAPFDRIEEDLNSGSPDWGKVRESADRFVGLAEALGKNTPRRGGAASWKAFTGRQLDDARAMLEGAEARDSKAIQIAHRRLAEACDACHDAHKFRPRD